MIRAKGKTSAKHNTEMTSESGRRAIQCYQSFVANNSYPRLTRNTRQGNLISAVTSLDIIQLFPFFVHKSLKNVCILGLVTLQNDIMPEINPGT